jgi:hypothetical protein
VRDGPIELGIVRLVDDAHATGAELIEHDVSADEGAALERISWISGRRDVRCPVAIVVRRSVIHGSELIRLALFYPQVH